MEGKALTAPERERLAGARPVSREKGGTGDRGVYPKVTRATVMHQSLAIQPPRIDANGIADPQAVEVVLDERALAAVAEANGDAIRTLVAAALLDLVARERTCARTGDGRGGVAAAAADLVAQDAAHDA